MFDRGSHMITASADAVRVGDWTPDLRDSEPPPGVEGHISFQPQSADTQYERDES